MTATNKFNICKQKRTFFIEWTFFIVKKTKKKLIVSQKLVAIVIEHSLSLTYKQNKKITDKLTKNEQKKMNDTKYAYAIGEPQSSPSLPDLESHGPLRHANIMFGHASPVAHL